LTHFDTTRWSVVRAAASEGSQARGALETLCSTYWYPLYMYIRYRGNSAEDAKDLIQEFFTRFLEKDYLKDVDQDKGKFRSFLLASVNHFLSNERDRARTLKRGGGVTFLPVDYDEVEERYAGTACQVRSAEKLFDRAWALATLEATLGRLRQEFVAAGKEDLFDKLKGTLTGQDDHIPYQELGEQLGLSEGAVKVAVHRLRRRYRDLLLEEIAATLAEGESVDEELRDLFSALGT